MRKLYSLLLCSSCCMLVTACIDNDYDLGKISTDNIAIGDETSRFEAPLAKVHVSMSDLSTSDNGTLIDEIFDEADIWLPTQLPGQDDNGYYADVQLLLHDNIYVDDLLTRLIEEMLSSSAKLDAVAALLQEKYFDNFSSMLPGVTQADFKAAFVDAFSSNATLREALSNEVKDLASSYLTTLDVDLDDVSYPIDHIDLSDEVVNMLSDNLDPAETPDPKNTLHLAGEIENRLPITLQITPSFTSTQIAFQPTTINANSTDNELAETRLYAEDLRTIVRGVTVELPVVIQKYYPGKGFETDSQTDPQPQLSFNLHIIKRGALKFEL